MTEAKWTFLPPFKLESFDETIPQGPCHAENDPQPGRAAARDRRTRKDQAKAFLNEMLADPLIRLVMSADGVSEAEIRNLYHGNVSHHGSPAITKGICT